MTSMWPVKPPPTTCGMITCRIISTIYPSTASLQSFTMHTTCNTTMSKCPYAWHAYCLPRKRRLQIWLISYCACTHGTCCAPSTGRNASAMPNCKCPVCALLGRACNVDRDIQNMMYSCHVVLMRSMNVMCVTASEAVCDMCAFYLL